MNFTLTTYRQLLTALKSGGYSFQTFADFIQNPKDKVVVMRHDVDKLPGNALRMAKIEREMGIAASYYFRTVPMSFDPGVMEDIARMGHEIGYHYENLDYVIQGLRNSGIEREGSSAFNVQRSVLEKLKRKVPKEEDKEELIDLGYEDFCRNLERFRENFEIKTICMHGSPLSRYDNRMIWEKYDYRELGILAEPYFDVDFAQVFYLTDTGRRWNHESASVRDRVGYENLGIQELRNLGIEELLSCHSTNEIIAAVDSNKFPQKAMINVHPQRWHDRHWPWVRELMGQNVKNMIKAIIVKRR